MIRGGKSIVKRRFNLYKTGAPKRENRGAEKIMTENVPELMKKHKSWGKKNVQKHVSIKKNVIPRYIA